MDILAIAIVILAFIVVASAGTFLVTLICYKEYVERRTGYTMPKQRRAPVSSGQTYCDNERGEPAKGNSQGNGTGGDGMNMVAVAGYFTIITAEADGCGAK